MNFCGLDFLSHTSAGTCLLIQGIACFFSNALVHILAHGPISHSALPDSHHHSHELRVR